MKKSCLVIKLCHFQLQCLDFPKKISNLATRLLNCCKKLFFKKNFSYFRVGGGGELLQNYFVMVGLDLPLPIK